MICHLMLLSFNCALTVIVIVVVFLFICPGLSLPFLLTLCVSVFSFGVLLTHHLLHFLLLPFLSHLKCEVLLVQNNNLLFILLFIQYSEVFGILDSG